MPIVQKHKNVTKHFFPSEEAYTKAMEQGLVQEGDEVYVEGEEINEELLEILNNKADLVDGKVPEEQLPEIASSWDDLKDKPFGETTSSEIAWDGDTTDRDVLTLGYMGETIQTLYKVSDLTPKAADINGGSFTKTDGTVVEINEEDNPCIDLSNATMTGAAIQGEGEFIIVHNLQFTCPGGIPGTQTAPSTGVYFSVSGTLKLVTEFETVKYIDEKYIPDSIMRKSEAVQVDMLEDDRTAQSYAKNRTHYIVKDRTAEGEVIVEEQEITVVSSQYYLKNKPQYSLFTIPMSFYCRVYINDICYDVLNWQFKDGGYFARLTDEISLIGTIAESETLILNIPNGTYNVKVCKLNPYYMPLDEGFIPNAIARKTDLETKADLVRGKVPREQLPETVTSWNDLIERPFEERSNIIKWNIDNIDYADKITIKSTTSSVTLYKVHGGTLSEEDLIGGTITIDGIEKQLGGSEIPVIPCTNFIINHPSSPALMKYIVVLKDCNLSFPNPTLTATYATTGIYFAEGVTEIRPSKSYIKQIDPKFIPELDYAKTEEVKEQLSNKADLVNGKVPSEQLPEFEIPEMDYIPNSEKGVPNGVSTLDENGKVPSEQLPDNIGGGLSEVAWNDVKDKPFGVTELFEPMGYTLNLDGSYIPVDATKQTVTVMEDMDSGSFVKMVFVSDRVLTQEELLSATITMSGINDGKIATQETKVSEALDEGMEITPLGSSSFALIIDSGIPIVAVVSNEDIQSNPDSLFGGASEGTYLAYVFMESYIAITKIQSSAIIKLPNEYLPERAYTTPNYAENDKNSPGYINNKPSYSRNEYLNFSYRTANEEDTVYLNDAKSEYLFWVGTVDDYNYIISLIISEWYNNTITTSKAGLITLSDPHHKAYEGTTNAIYINYAGTHTVKYNYEDKELTFPKAGLYIYHNALNNTIRYYTSATISIFRNDLQPTFNQGERYSVKNNPFYYNTLYLYESNSEVVHGAICPNDGTYDTYLYFRGMLNGDLTIPDRSRLEMLCNIDGVETKLTGTMTNGRCVFYANNKARFVLVNSTMSFYQYEGMRITNKYFNIPHNGLYEIAYTNDEPSLTYPSSYNWAYPITICRVMDGVETSFNKGVANGYASLDSQGQIPVEQIPKSVMDFLITMGYTG